MIIQKSGNFFDYDASIRVNTVNCVGVMGAGVALQFKNLFPQMFNEYKKLCVLNELRPGKLHIWKSENIFDNLEIINFPTKDHWKDPSEYDYINKGLNALHDYLKHSSGETITIPALGCGHGGLDWNIVSKLIHEKLSDLNHNILLFSPESSQDTSINNKDILAQNNISNITPNDKNFPNKIRGKTSKIFYYYGNEELLNTRIINIISSKKPTEKEKNILLDILKELKYNNYTVLLRGDKSYEIDIIKFLLENEINTIVNPSKGLINFNIRKDIKQLINKKNFLLYNTLKNQNANWSISNFSSNYKESFDLSDIDLFNISDLSEILKLLKQINLNKKFYYINYFPESLKEIVTDKLVEKVGKTQQGKPNIQKILY